MKIGVDVITGFLGEGKTTFINDYINYTKVYGERIAVICYESGTVNVNEQKNNENIIYVKYINDDTELFNDTINEIMQHIKPHRIIIEYNGTMTLDTLYINLKNKDIINEIKLFNIIFVGSALNIQSYMKNLGDLILPLIQNCDVIVINRCDKLSIPRDNIKLELENSNHKAHVFVEDTNEKVLKAMDLNNLILKENERKWLNKLIDYCNKWK